MNFTAPTSLLWRRRKEIKKTKTVKTVKCGLCWYDKDHIRKYFQFATFVLTPFLQKGFPPDSTQRSSLSIVLNLTEWNARWGARLLKVQKLFTQPVGHEACHFGLCASLEYFLPTCSPPMIMIFKKIVICPLFFSTFSEKLDAVSRKSFQKKISSLS